jgi:glutaredoxin
MYWYREILAILPTIFSAPVKRNSGERQRAERLANSLTLYDLSTCPYSAKVRRHLKHLNISITVKNLKRCHIYESELIAGGGRAQVPCLRIETAQGSRWLYKSKDILDYLDKKFMPKESVCKSNAL